MIEHLYIHVPFCLNKCGYCAFYSETGWDEELLDRYVAGVLSELEARVEGGLKWRTVYFGGGTPSLLGAHRVGSILEAVAACGTLTEAEITLEANPETVTSALLADLGSAGVNRLSLGLQSLNDSELRYLGRVHDGRRGREALAAGSAAFDRVSIDLIYGLPGQTVPGWLDMLKESVALGTEHLSAYELSYEPGTALGAKGSDAPGHADYFFATHECLAELGLTGYEVSNFARSRAARSRHNEATWCYRPYMGVAPGSHSLEVTDETATRRYNRASLADYLAGAAEGVVPHDTETLTSEQQLLERLMLGLRTTAGLDLSHLNHLFDPPSGAGLNKRLVRLEEQDLLRRDKDLIRPTLRGMALADRLASDLSE